MCNGLIEAGATLKWVYDPDPAKVAAFPRLIQVTVASSEAQVLQDAEVRLVAVAAIPSERCELGLKVMSHGKDYFTDKTPFTTLEQVNTLARKPRRQARSTWSITVNDCMWRVPSMPGS